MSGSVEKADHIQIQRQMARQEIEELEKKLGVQEPNRSYMEETGIKWRYGKPEYSVANLSYFKGKSQNHTTGSLEKVVEDLVKTWEMEASHKIDPNQWETIDVQKYQMSVNGAPPMKTPRIFELGNYSAALNGAVRKELYDTEKETFESSHNLFRGAFKNGFPWELIAVFSGPPKVTFSWRHWAVFDGSYRGIEGKGQTVELYGICIAHVNEAFKIENMELYYKPEEFLEVLEGTRPIEDLQRGKSLVGSGCPFMKN